MARYDAGWGRGAPGGYGGWQRSRGPLREQAGFGAQPGVAGRYDQLFEDFGGSGEGVYGPSRYGLGPYHQRLRNRRRSDDELRAEVEEALFYDTWVDADAIQVQVRDGIVTLAGVLPNYEEIRYATDDAWDVDGVVGVRSNLTVSRE
jgi:osmotically-inducible protein OsmY